jgi:hypothetical protein
VLWAWAVLIFLAVVFFSVVEARAEPPDIADLEGVHQEMRRLETVPEPSWPILDGVIDCDDWARWGQRELEGRGLEAEIWYGRDPFGRPHMVVCSEGVCLDRVWDRLMPLSAYEGWKRL